MSKVVVVCMQSLSLWRWIIIFQVVSQKSNDAFDSHQPILDIVAGPDADYGARPHPHPGQPHPNIGHMPLRLSEGLTPSCSLVFEPHSAYLKEKNLPIQINLPSRCLRSQTWEDKFGKCLSWNFCFPFPCWELTVSSGWNQALETINTFSCPLKLTRER